MPVIPRIVIGALIFGACYLIDKGFSKAFRSKAQHMSGLAVRVNKRYGAFGVILFALGVGAILAGLSGEWILIAGGALILIAGICMVVYYLTFGVFYDDDSFLVSGFGQKGTSHLYKEIQQQRLYLVQGGNVIIELYLNDGSTVSLQSNMEGVYPFLDTAFAGWCRQTGTDPNTCSFYNPSNHWWFPHEEES